MISTFQVFFSLKNKPNHYDYDDITFKVDLSVAIGVEYVDDALHQWVLLQLRQRHELLHAQRARVVQV